MARTAGAERRRARRHIRRLSVRYGESELTGSGFTNDLSETGAFVVAARLPPLGTRVRLQVHLNTSRSVYFEGVVERHKLVPKGLAQLEKGGFGVRFLKPDELVRELLPPSAHAPQFKLSLGSADELRQRFEAEMKHGGVFVLTGELLPRDAQVVLQLELRHLGSIIELPCTVIALVNGPTVPAASRGLGLAFQDARRALQILQPLLG